MNYCRRKNLLVCFILSFCCFWYMFFFFLFFGVIGNILICCVYNWKWERKCKVFILFILIFVWVDLLNCLFMMFFEIVLLVNIIFFDYLIFCKIFCWLIYYLNCFFIMILFGIVLDWLFGIRYMFKRLLFGIMWCKIYFVLFFVIVVLMIWLVLFFFGIYINVYYGIFFKICFIDDDYILN